MGFGGHLLPSLNREILAARRNSMPLIAHLNGSKPDPQCVHFLTPKIIEFPCLSDFDLSVGGPWDWDRFRF